MAEVIVRGGITGATPDDSNDIGARGRRPVSKSGMGGLNPSTNPTEKKGAAVSSKGQPKPAPHDSTRFTG